MLLLFLFQIMRLQIIDNKIRIFPDFYIPAKGTTITVTQNCCVTNTIEISRVYTHKIVVPSRYVGNPTLTTLIIGTTAYALNIDINSDLSLAKTILNNQLILSIPDASADILKEGTDLVILLKNVFTNVSAEAYYTGITFNPDVILTNGYLHDFVYTTDGIYTFTIITKDINNNVVTDKKCILISNNLPCLIADYLILNKSTTVHLKYFSLVNALECNCICDELCLLYKEIVQELKLEDKCKVC